MKLQLQLIDLNPMLVAAWREAFKEFPEVIVQEGNLLACAENTVVSPANGYGFMDGGIDQAYRDFFGRQMESRVQETISRRPEGFLPVGASLVVATGHHRIPFMIVAPTMLMPEAASEADCYRAMRAVLRIAEQHPEVGRSVYCPGLATGVGGVDPATAAREMAHAYGDWKDVKREAASSPCQAPPGYWSGESEVQ